jgi:parvulin-like peptidyl-prolyl isomerase
MQKEFEQSAFALKLGEMSGIVETQSGLHLIERYVHIGVGSAATDSFSESYQSNLKSPQSENREELFEESSTASIVGFVVLNDRACFNP